MHKECYTESNFKLSLRGDTWECGDTKEVRLSQTGHGEAEEETCEPRNGEQATLRRKNDMGKVRPNALNSG